MASNISSATTVAYINTSVRSRTIVLPSTFNIEGKFVTVKDSSSNAAINPIRVIGLGGDRFEGGVTSITINQNFGFASFVAHNGIWYSLARSATTTTTVTSGNNSNPGVSSLSSIVAYGLSTIRRQPTPGVSSLSSIVAYGLSSLRRYVDNIGPGGSNSSNPGVSSLSSIVAYGLSSLRIYADRIGSNSSNPGVSSLSSIVSYGLSSVAGGHGVSSLSSIVSYGLSTVSGTHGVSSLSSIVAYGLSTLLLDINTKISNFTNSNEGVSSLSSIISYGLSSLTQSSLRMTTIGPMTLYGRGGIGLSTMDTPPADTITNAFAKVDHWLFNNLVDQPPAPVSNINTQSKSGGFQTYQTFDPPFQFKSAFTPNMWLPSIISLNINILERSRSNIISCNITDSIYLPRGSCNLAGFYFDIRKYNNQQLFPFTYGTISNLMYINISQYIPPIPDNPYIVEISYSNYSREPVHNLTSEWTVFIGDGPFAPYDLSIDSINFNSFTTSFTLSNSDRKIDTNKNIYLDGFVNIFFDKNNYPRRYNCNISYYDNYSNIRNYSLINCNRGDRITVPITNLPADTGLYFNTYANNTYTDSNGQLSSNSYSERTLLPPLIGNRLSNITINGKSQYINQGLIYSNILIDPKPVEVLYNYLSSSDFQFIIYLNDINSRIQLHTQENSGSDQQEIASVQIILDDFEPNISYFDGFPNIVDADYKPREGFSQLFCGNIRDSYTGNFNLSNFYLNINNMQYYIAKDYFSPRAEPHTFTIILSNENLPNCNVSGEIYSDDLVGLPSIVNISNYRNISNDGTYKYVSGILVLSNNVTFDLNVDVTNFANYFYPAVDIFGSLGLSFGGYSTAILNIYSNVRIYNINDSDAIGAIAPNPTRFKLNNIDFSPTGVSLLTNGDPTGTNRVRANINSLKNIVGTANLISCNLQYYFDYWSLSNINNNLASVKSPGGLRMEAASNSCNTTFRPYDHTQSIIGNNSCNNYNLEIPLVEGYHSIGTSIGENYNYIHNFWPVVGFPEYNYPDYSEIRGDGVTRYATFKYSLSNSRSNFVNLLEFNFNSYNEIENIGPNCNFNSTIVRTLWYKIDNIGSYNTGWLNGNVTKDNYLPFNSGDAINGAAGLRSNNIYREIIGAKRYFSIIPIPASCNFDVYVKIGLATRGKFDYIIITPFNESTPGAPIIINLTQTGNNDSNFNLTAEWTNPTGYGPIISNRVIACNVIVPGYPCRWVSAGNEYVNDTVTCNVNGESSTFTVINANTNYNIYITSLNDVDFGLTATRQILTEFPNTDLPFYHTSKSINMNTSYYTYCNAIPFGSNSTISNVQNYNTVMTGSFINFNIGTDPITFNYESNQAGSNLSQVALYIRGTVNATTRVSQFQFNNSLYSNTDLTSVNGSNGVGLTLQLSNLTDKYPNASWPTISGFYYTGKVFFRASNTFVTPSVSGYSFILSNSSGSNLQSSTYYFDNLATNVSPTINSVFIDTTNITNYWTYVSGILTFNSTCNYNFWIQASNLGSNFYRNSPVRVTLSNNTFTSNFPFVPGTTKFYSTCNIGTVNELTSVANSQNNTYFNWSNVSIGQSYTFSNPLRVNASASNLNSNGTNSIFEFINVSGGKLFFDSASVLLRNDTKNSNYPGTTNYGLRVESGVGAYPTWNQTGSTSTSLFGFSNIDSTLLTGPYLNELQIVNGAYVGTNANCNYSAAVLYTPPGTSYPNYSAVYTTTGLMRYATFMWYIGTGIPPKYNTVDFNINGNDFPINSANRDITQYSGGVRLQYLAIGLPTPTFTNSIWPPAQSNRTTAWLNGNAIAQSVRNSTMRTTNNTAGGLNVTLTPTIRRSVTLSFGDSVGTRPFLFFVRVGIPTTSNFKFNNIELISLT